MDTNGYVLGCHPTGHQTDSTHILDIPKGCADSGEDDLHAAIRELKEETGIELSSTQSIYDMGIHPHVKKKKSHIFFTFSNEPISSLVEKCKCSSYFTDKNGVEHPEVDSFYSVSSTSYNMFFEKIQAHVEKAYERYLLDFPF